MGASVDERAARKKMSSNINAPNGTSGRFRRKAVQP